MQSRENFGRVIRGSAAAMLALLFSLAGLAPLAAAMSEGSGCCPSGASHACCRRHHHTGSDGPAFTPASCASRCGCATMAQGNGAPGPVESTASHATSLPVEGSAPAGDGTTPARFVSSHLHQRPPPASLA